MASLGQPYLNMVIGPENYFRFRYESEPGSHGGLQGKKPAGEKKSRGNKYFPTVKLENYHGTKPAIIRVSLYTEKNEKHVLELKGKNARGGMCYEDLDKDHIAKFTNLTIMSKKKENVYELLMDRKIKNLKSKLSASDKAKFLKTSEKELKKEAKEILNTVKLCFECFLKDNERVHLCDPLFSEPIHNQKSTEKGGLKIHRISHYKGSCKGGEDVVILCDKVQKDTIKVLFYECDENSDSMVWQDFGTFAPADVHYQVAIPFKTPCYTPNVDKKVNVCLMRNGEFSEPVEFIYIAETDLLEPRKKRKINVDGSRLFKENSLPSEMSPSSSSTGASSDCFVENQENTFNRFNIPSIAEVIPQYLEPADGASSDCFVENQENTFIFNIQSNDEVIPQYLEPADGSLINQDLNVCMEEFLKMNKEELESTLMDSSIYGALFSEHIQEIPVGNMQCDGAVSSSYFVEPRYRADVGHLKGKIASEETIHNQSLSLWSTEKYQKSLKTSLDRRSSLGQLEGQMGISKLMRNMSIENDVSQNVDKNGINHRNKLLAHKNSKFLSLHDEMGNTLLHLAVLQRESIKAFYNVDRILISNIANVQNHDKNTAIILATKLDHAPFVWMLLQNGADPNIKDANGNNCLHIAACNNSFNCMKELLGNLKSISGVNNFNYEGLTPLHLAIINSSNECFHLLMDVADVNILEKKGGNSPLHFAVEMQRFVIPLLEQSDIDVNIQNFRGDTPLHIASAVKKGPCSTDYVQLLLNAGADPLLKNFKQYSEDSDEEKSENKEIDGQTSLDVARNSHILKQLEQAIQKQNKSEGNEKLYKLLDEQLSIEDWKSIMMCMGVDDCYFNSLEVCSSSPARAVLTYSQQLYGEEYMDTLPKIFKMAGLNDAAETILQQHN